MQGQATPERGRIIYMANPVRAALPAMAAGQLGMIVTPGQGNRLPPDVLWCADNGCGPGKHGVGAGYPGDRKYLLFLSRMSAIARERCLFAVAPDVVCDAPASLARLERFYAAVRGLFGLPVAFAAQDGLELLDVPWHAFDVLFIGGSTEWKLGDEAAQLVKEAKARGKRVHMGRVNSRKRLLYAQSIGCDSADGTYCTFAPSKNVPKLLSWLEEINADLPERRDLPVARATLALATPPQQESKEETVKSECTHPHRQGAALCGDCPRRIAAKTAAYYEREKELDETLTAQAEQRSAVAVRPRGQLVRETQRIDGAELLGYVHGWLGQLARFPSPAAHDVATAWGAHQLARDEGGTLLGESTPRLMLLSSEPGSGKTRVLNLLRMIGGGRYGLLTEPTAWALAHILGPEHEAAFIDEADVLFGKGTRKEQVRALLNAGYTRDGVIAHMRGSKVEALSAFGPTALAGLDVMATATGTSLAPLFTRSIVIRMHKSAEAVPPIGTLAREQAAMLHQALSLWVAQNRGSLAGEITDLPDWLINRDGEIWSPLLRIAAVAGGDWPDRIMTAAAELCGAWEQAEQPAEDEDIMGGLAEMFGQPLAIGKE